MVATSEFVVNLRGPAIREGSLATTRFPLSQVNMKTLLKPPSLFSELAIDAAPRHSETTFLQSSSKSKCM